MIGQKHLPPHLQVPVMLFQYFAHELVEILHLDIIVPPVKVDDSRILGKHQHIVLVVFPVAHIPCLQGPAPQILIVRAVKPPLGLLRMPQITGNAVQIPELKIIFPPFLADKFTDLPQLPVFPFIFHEKRFLDIVCLDRHFHCFM